MTIAADREVVRLGAFERRDRFNEARRSWASAHPFEVRHTPFNVAASRVHLWGVAGGGYRRRVVASDALSAMTVAGIALGSIVGVGRDAVLLTIAGTMGFLILVSLNRGYEPKGIGDGSAEYQALLRSGVYSAVLLMGISYAAKVEISRTLVFAGVPLLVLASIAGRYVQRRFLHRARAHGLAMMRTLVVGDPADVARVVDDLAAAPHHGYQVAGACLTGFRADARDVGVPVVGALADIPQVVVDRAIDVVVVAGSALSGDALRRLSWALDRGGAQLTVVPDLVEVTAPRLTLRPVAGLSLLEVEVGAPRNRMLAKAALDATVGSLLLLIALPVILLAAVLVRVTSDGRSFYRQDRVGVDGRVFTMWKLRSMYSDADRRRAALAGQNDGAGVLFKMKDDPRVTPVGRFLRRFSLDELPQLLNVVKGDMSLVGPRPPLVAEVAAYPDPAHRRLRVRPGLTGLWQISGRSDLSWDDSVRLDLRYVDNWSLTMDLVILWKTARAVLLGTGAY